ncbi:MAG: molybdenum cofactor guanylyltransferase [Proteobacteria bacterium]|nr:molybdenum cofactor guanylyltransferase [Pseudomonadota bacterium]
MLAGGEGRRVGGADKGLLMLDGRPLVAHVIAALRGQVGHMLICANRNADHYAQFAPVIADGAEGFRGPLAGIAAALRACASEWLLTVPVDCPRPPQDLAQRLLAGIGGYRTAVAVDGTTRQPLFALYARELAASAAQALVRELGVWQWQDEIGVATVDFSDARGAFANLNSPEDFRNWQNALHE